MIFTTWKSPPTYSAQCWIYNGGAALAVDPDPNVTPPAADRIIQLHPRYLRAMVGQQFPQVTVWLANGTTCSVRVWFYEDSLGRWIGTLTPTVLDYSAISRLNSAGTPFAAGLRAFAQVTANVGTTRIAMSFR